MSKINKAIVFAAGVGSRLKPFTDHHPKALVEVGGRPMLANVIEKLISYGVDEIVVNVHHFSEQIVEFLVANDNFGITIHISDESDKLLDTGGAIVAASQWFEPEDDFIVHNADIFTDFDLSDMMRTHGYLNALATLLVAERQTSRYLLFDDRVEMKGWTNISTGEVKPASIVTAEGYDKFAFGGVHILSGKIIPALKEYATKLGYCGTRDTVPKFSITDFYIDICRTLPVFGYLPAEKYNWHDIGKPQSLVDARNSVISNCEEN